MAEFTREDLIQAIYGQESSGGKADTSQENYAGARGPMQVTHEWRNISSTASRT